jgi:hypothetical protein
MSEARWTPGIGDPSIFGWFTVVAYFVAALLCYRADRLREERRIWWSIAVLLVALGINKQLDLQSWFTQVGRDMARVEGWYDYRGYVQTLFIVAMAIGGLFCARRLYQVAQRHSNCVRVGLNGLALLLAFIVIRAASFHHFDQLIGTSILGFRFNWIFELGGIAVIAAAALCARRRSAL